MTKKILSLILSVVLAISLFGCGNINENMESEHPTIADGQVEESIGVSDNETIPKESIPEESAPEESVPDESTLPTEEIHVHDWMDTVFAPTCTEEGYTEHICETCGEIERDSVVAANGHTWTSWETTVEATEDSTGSAERVCSVCQTVETRVLEKIPVNHTHSYTSAVTRDATCNLAGIKTFSCSCGDTYTEDIPKISHNYDDKVVPPTCSLRGYTEHTCSSCGSVYIDTYVDVAPHSYTSTTTSPTCTEKGYTKYKCQNCDYSYIGNETSAKGHSWGEWTLTKEATETSTGVKTRTCRNCTSTETEVVPKLEHIHSYTPTVTAPTCVDAGYTTYKCNCGQSYTADKVSAAGHSWSNWVVTRPATEDASGLKERACGVCGATESDVIPKLDKHIHSYVRTSTVKPTCDADGYHIETCSCGDSQTVTIPATGHDWKYNYKSEEGHYEGNIACHCGGWSCSANSDYISSFSAHVNSVPAEDRYNHSYYENIYWVVDVPREEWYSCKNCGATK